MSLFGRRNDLTWRWLTHLGDVAMLARSVAVRPAAPRLGAHEAVRQTEATWFIRGKEKPGERVALWTPTPAPRR